MDEVITINAGDIRRDTSAVMSQVAHGGKRFVVERHGRAMMALVSVEDLRKLQEIDKAASLKGRYTELLREARALRRRILEERHGELMPDSVETLRSIRDEN